MENNSVANRRKSDFSQPALGVPSMFNASSNNMSQPLHIENPLFYQMPDLEEIPQKQETTHLEKGQFILYTTQPIGGITANLPTSPAGVSHYSHNPTKVYAFNKSEKPGSSYHSRPFNKLNALTPNSGTSYDSSKYPNVD